MDTSPAQPQDSRDADLSLHHDDEVTPISHLGFRFFFTCVCWLVLGMNVSAGKAFFVSTFIFILPLFMDYLKFRPKTKKRKTWNWVALIISGIFLFISSCGLVDILTIVSTQDDLVIKVSSNFIIGKGLSISVSFLWVSFALSVIVTGFDWLIPRTPAEQTMVASRPDIAR